MQTVRIVGGGSAEVRHVRMYAYAVRGHRSDAARCAALKIDTQPSLHAVAPN